VFRGQEGFGVRLRDMKTGVETTLVQSPVDMRARISPDGSTIAYNPSSLNEKESLIYLISPAGDDARKFCETCGLIYPWSPDGKRILYRSGDPIRFSAIEVATGRQSQIVAHPKYSIYSAVLPPGWKDGFRRSSTDIHFSPSCWRVRGMSRKRKRKHKP
jgi:hypothetical protein